MENILLKKHTRQSINKSNRPLQRQLLLKPQCRMSKFTAKNSEHANQILQRVNKLIPLLNHPNLTNIKECYAKDSQTNNPFYNAQDPNTKHVFIKTQVLPGQKLFEQVVNKLHIHEIKNIYIKIQEVIKYLHQNNFEIINLEPVNIFIDQQLNVRLELAIFLKYILGQYMSLKYHQAVKLYYEIKNQKSELFVTFTLKLCFLQMMMRKKMICQRCGSAQYLRYCKNQICVQKKLFCIKCEQQSHFFHKAKNIKQLSFAQTTIILQENHPCLNIEIDDQNNWILDIFEFIKKIEVTNKKYNLKYIVDLTKNTIIYSQKYSVYCCQEQEFTYNSYENRKKEQCVISAIYLEQFNLISQSNLLGSYLRVNRNKQRLKRNNR